MSKNKNLLLNLVIYVFVFILIYNLLDFLYATVITKTGYSFNWRTHILPGVVGGSLYALLKLKMTSKQSEPQKERLSRKRSHHKK